jgi:hypothetical protein
MKDVEDEDTTDIDPAFLVGADTEQLSRTLCKVARIIVELDGDERQEKLTNALTKRRRDDPDKFVVPSDRVAVAMRGWGLTVSETMVRKHRREVCTCAR